MLWLGLHLPNLGLEIFEAAAPGTPQVLVEDNRVILQNPAAVAAGITPGSTLATAHSIEPRLRHCNRDEIRERERLELLAGALYGFSSHVSTQPPSSLVLEAGGSLELFGDLAKLEQAVRETCEALGHVTIMRTALTPSAAMTLARARQDDLKHVPLELTELATSMVERFANMGMHALGALIALPEDELAHRFGPELVNYLKRLTGRMPDPREAVTPAEAFSSRLHLLEAVTGKDALLFPMQRLLGELQIWLVSRQLGAEQIVWTLDDHGSKDTAELTIRFARAQQQREAFLDITRLKLESAELPGDVLGIGLRAERLVPWQAGSRTLFQSQPGQAPADAAGLVDQLCARLGNRACHGIRPVDQHAPEQAWRRSRPAMNGRGGRRSRSRSGKHGNGRATDGEEALLPAPDERPIWLLSRPRPINRSELKLLKGPERIRTAWWQRGISRDYYVARDRRGAECWAFVDAGNNWYLHGYFA